MAKNIINNDFDALTIAKARAYTMSKLIVVVASICIIASFVFAFFVFSESYSKIAVVDTGGNYLQTTVENEKELQRVLILQTCANLNYYVNSFDMNGYLDNYNRARNYCTIDELNKITEFYKGERMYFDALERGVIFRSELNKIHEVAVKDKNVIYVKFNALLTKIDGQTKVIFLIEAEGEIEKIKPQFPDNTTGYFFTRYTQTLTPYIETQNKQDDEF